jgi:hypothetical protein
MKTLKQIWIKRGFIFNKQFMKKQILQKMILFKIKIRIVKQEKNRWEK